MHQQHSCSTFACRYNEHAPSLNETRCETANDIGQFTITSRSTGDYLTAAIQYCLYCGPEEGHDRICPHLVSFDYIMYQTDCLFDPDDFIAGTVAWESTKVLTSASLVLFAHSQTATRKNAAGLQYRQWSNKALGTDCRFCYDCSNLRSVVHDIRSNRRHIFARERMCGWLEVRTVYDPHFNLSNGI